MAVPSPIATSTGILRPPATDTAAGRSGSPGGTTGGLTPTLMIARVGPPAFMSWYF